MSEELQQKLRTQLWTVANTLRGNMSASDFMYFTLGFIFYKYLSEKIEMYIDGELEADEMTFKEAWASDEQELKDEIREISMENLGYFIEPGFLYSSVIEAIKRKENILPMLERSLKKISEVSSPTSISPHLSWARLPMTRIRLSAMCCWHSMTLTSD